MILYDKDARKVLKDGVDFLANAVRVTLGPCGSNVVISKDGQPILTKDGVTVAKSIHDDKLETSINLIRSVSEKTGDQAGDGTSSSSVLAQEIVRLVFEDMDKHPEFKPIYIKRGIDKAAEDIVAKVKEMSIPVGDRMHLIATISSNGDKQIADITTEVITRIGGNGLVSVKPSDSTTYVSYSEGLRWETSYMSPNFVTDPVKMEVDYTGAHILIVDLKIEKIQAILKPMEYCRSQNIPLIIACKDIDQDVLNTLVLNHLNKIVKCCVVKIPGHSEYRSENILDLRALIGSAEVVDRVVITKSGMYISNSRSNSESKQTRIDQLKHKLTLEDINEEDITNRIANISNAFATIYVAGNSDVEIQEKIDRYDDALCALKSALEEGIVPGGGNTLHLIGMFMNKASTKDPSFNIGYTNMILATKAPLRQIMENGSDKPTNTSKHTIYKDGKFIEVDSALDENIIDPTKVVRLTVENAASIAGAIITTKCVIL